MVNWKELDQQAKQWIREAGTKIKASFNEALTVETKSNANDLVTNMDKSIEQYFIQRIKAAYPTHRILGEEGFGDDIKALDGVVWIVDPIDGTMNFVHQQRNFAISIGIYEDGIGKIGLIYDVIHDELYHASKGSGAFLNDTPISKLEEVEVPQAIIGLNALWVTKNNRIDPQILAPLVQQARGTRSYGSATIEIAYVATGRLDAYLSMRLAPWDIAAGLILIEELGGVATTLDGEELNLLKSSSFLVAKPGLHRTILKDYLQQEK